MTDERLTKTGRVSAAACAVLMAASVASGSVSPVAENHAIEQIQRYCAVSFRNAQIRRDEWADCTQETLAELLRRIPTESLPVAITQSGSEERRELNRSMWCAIQRHRRAHRHLQLEGEVRDDSRADVESSGELDELLSGAFGQLSDRQRQILTLWSQNWTVAEISDQMSMPAARVSDEKYKAIRKLRQQLDVTLPS